MLGVDTHKDAHVTAVVTVLGAAYGAALTRVCTPKASRSRRSIGPTGRRAVATSSPTQSTPRRPHVPNRRAVESSNRATATAKTSGGPAELLRLFKLTKASANG